VFWLAFSLDLASTFGLPLGNSLLKRSCPMALFKGNIASLVSGKVGGLVYQRNMRIRPYRMPTNPRTTLQDVVRGAFVVAAALWSAIGDANQSAWTAWAALHPKTNRIGDSITLTGKQALIGLNVPRIQAGMAAISDPPAMEQLNITPVGAGPAGVITGGLNTLTVSGVTLGTTQTLSVYVGKPRSPSSVRGRKALVYAGSIVGATTPVTTGSVVLPSGVAVAGDVFDVTYVTRLTGSFLVATNYETLVAV